MLTKFPREVFRKTSGGFFNSLERKNQGIRTHQTKLSKQLRKFEMKRDVLTDGIQNYDDALFIRKSFVPLYVNNY